MDTIKAVRITPLLMPLKQPYVWAQGVTEHFVVNLIEIEAKSGAIGIGECTTAPDAGALKIVLERMTRHFIGRSVFEVNALRTKSFRAEYQAFGANNPRAGNQLLSGIDMACWDLMGKLTGRPAYDLFGGSQRAAVGYFYFLQGKSIDEIVADAAHAVSIGEPVIYLKIGLGEDYDLEATRRVREVIGKASLRLDANEAWDVATAIRMIRKLEKYDPDFIEQPTPSWSLPALAQVKKSVGVAIAADQAVFTLNDVYEVCRMQAADVIVIGPREIGGIQPMVKAAAIAEAAGINVCIHSSFTTGITTCAEYHIGKFIPNLDIGNQIMWQLMRDNLVAAPNLTPKQGKLALPVEPGLGFELDAGAVEAAAKRYAAWRSAAR